MRLPYSSYLNRQDTLRPNVTEVNQPRGFLTLLKAYDAYLYLTAQQSPLLHQSGLLVSKDESFSERLKED